MMSEVSFRWIPRMLTPEQKACRQQLSEKNLDMLGVNSENFFSRIIKGDGIWVHHHDPESKQESMQWKHKGSPNPKKFRVQQSARKITATVFWDSEGVLLLESMPHKTILLDTPMLPQCWLYAWISNRNAVESWQQVSCCFIAMHPHTQVTHIAGCYMEMWLHRA